MNEEIGNALYDDPALAQFYDLANPWREDFDFCVKLAKSGFRVLDLGCGTGMFAAALGEKCMVTGVDPALGMLEIARTREGGGAVTWVAGDARSLRLETEFDLVVLTGHTFQVFLDEDEQASVLATIAAHLKPSGRFIFDSRNPNFVAPKTRESGSNEHRVVHPEHGEIETWNESSYDLTRDILSYENGYRILASGKEFTAKAQIKYTSRDKLARLMNTAGLRVDEWFGDWQGTAWHAESREIIPFGRLA